MKLLGKRVLLSTPKRKESIIELTPETERAMDEDMIKLWTALEVYAIGTDVTLVKAKDKILLTGVSCLRNAILTNSHPSSASKPNGLSILLLAPRPKITQPINLPPSHAPTLTSFPTGITLL